MHNIKTYINKIKIAALLFFIYSINFAHADTNPPVKKTPKVDPAITKATSNLGDKTLQDLVTDFVKLTAVYVLQLLLALTILVFLWGLMKYMFKGQGSDTARSEGRKLMLWGVIGIFVITSIWGLVAIFASFVGHGSVVIPQFK